MKLISRLQKKAQQCFTYVSHVIEQPLPGGVTVAQGPLEPLAMVRIHAG
jgi:hypothetical protein